MYVCGERARERICVRAYVRCVSSLQILFVIIITTVIFIIHINLPISLP